RHRRTDSCEIPSLLATDLIASNSEISDSSIVVSNNRSARSRNSVEYLRGMLLILLYGSEQNLGHFNGGLPAAFGQAAVVGAAGEEQVVGVGETAVLPGGLVVGFGVVAGLTAAGCGAAAVAGVADEALIGGGDRKSAV